jgi:hypothetical protein
MNFFKKVAAFFAGLFSPRTAAALLAGIRKATPYIKTAMELAGIVAGVVGGPVGRTVASVIAAAGSIGVDALLKPDASDAELATATRDIVVEALRKRFPNASVSDLIRAVELAVGALKSQGV